MEPELPTARSVADAPVPSDAAPAASTASAADEMGETDELDELARARRTTKEQFAIGCRILAMEGQGDIIWGHVACRVPGEPNRLYMKPATMGLDEIAADDLIEIDLDGRRMAGERPVHSEVFIHTEILRARPQARCVVHTHPPYAVAFGSTERALLPIGHEGSYFVDGLPIFSQTTDLIVTPERGRAVAQTLGPHNAVLLRNHGIVTVGQSIAEAVFVALLLEKACYMQLLAMQMGGAAAWTAADEARTKRQRIYRPAAIQQAFAYYARKLQAAGGAAPRSS
jgi:L-fuculose-phosphate aldolase